MTLTELANKYGSDKGDKHFEAHNYTPFFEEILSVYPSDLSILEIGVMDPRFPGGSMRMWREWRPSAKLFGLDINENAKLLAAELGADIFIADQNSTSHLREVIQKMGKVDVIIDDGSHFLPHVATSLMVLWDALKDGGVYIIEDLHTPQSQPRHSLDEIVNELNPKRWTWSHDDKLLILWK